MKIDAIPTIDINRLFSSEQAEVLVRPFSEYLHQHHKTLDVAHRHNFYHLVFFLKGIGTHTIDFTTFNVFPNQIYFMVPGQVHSWSFQGDVDGYVVNFTESLFESFLLKGGYLENFSFFNGIAIDGVINLPGDLAREIETIFKKMLSKPQRGIFGLDMIRVLLLEMFMLIEQNTLFHKSQSIPHYNYTLLRNYQKLIEKNYLTLRLPKEYADLLFITPNHLNALCKAHLGIQAGELIRNRIILEARRLLVNLTLSVSQVGYSLNFNDNSYFTKFFRKHTGMTPEEFRRKNS
ncbi:helix-turn-helix transcriptional regulator [Dyadobacter sp. CY261]|uniref:AraC family transcriptional regulator n=1 Tax=Dyadobacter sp. CY261 TaxID=2907203 RepID=UPI001F29C32B|nr:helix-turn-helix domain-containing protein [Dyadobacter sp. CY261]MCF0074929.1 helix-turn-helix transcriptional regulator [Dyadobacter sp. CY261]